MKATSSLSLLPLILVFGACSSSSNQNGNQNGTTPDAGDSGSSGDSSDDGGGQAAMVTSYEAKLSGANVAPTAVVTPSSGDAKLGLESDGQTLDYDITQNVANPTSINLHIGAPLEQGNVTHQLTPISAHMTGKVTLTSDETTALAADQLYLDVLSQAHPGGEIRGQVTPPGSTVYTATPQGAQEVPAILSNYAAHASFILSQDGTQAVYHMVTGATPTNVLLVRAIATINGQVVYPLTPTGSTIDGTLTLAAGDQADFQANHFYVNIQTQQNPTGELRGQVIPSGSTLYSGAMLGNNEVPPISTQATGGAQFVLSPDQKTIAYEIDVSGIIPTSADMDDGASGKNGPTLYQLTLDQNGAQGSINFAGNDLPMLQQGLTYANVHTASNSNGELRAQLVSHSN
ncbi:MAG TPA: CHRD domain-containing protein [Polyangiaceae bacterium]|nr:CHRD domain-containing protein [Polyangiaceae bacterium]